MSTAPAAAAAHTWGQCRAPGCPWAAFSTVLPFCLSQGAEQPLPLTAALGRGGGRSCSCDPPALPLCHPSRGLTQLSWQSFACPCSWCFFPLRSGSGQGMGFIVWKESLVLCPCDPSSGTDGQSPPFTLLGLPLPAQSSRIHHAHKLSSQRTG